MMAPISAMPAIYKGSVRGNARVSSRLPGAASAEPDYAARQRWGLLSATGFALILIGIGNGTRAGPFEAPNGSEPSGQKRGK